MDDIYEQIYSDFDEFMAKADTFIEKMKANNEKRKQLEKPMNIHPLTETDTQVHFIITSVKQGLCTKEEAQKALNKLREEKVIKDNMYQGRSL